MFFYAGNKKKFICIAKMRPEQSLVPDFEERYKETLELKIADLANGAGELMVESFVAGLTEGLHCIDLKEDFR